MDNKTKILVVDDSELMRIKLCFILTDNFIEPNIFCAASIESAWEILLKENIDVVVLDMYLPGINGADLINDMLQNEKLKEIPIVVVTGTHKDSFVKMSYERYVYAYLHKPVDRKKLLKTIKECTTDRPNAL